MDTPLPAPDPAPPRAADAAPLPGANSTPPAAGEPAAPGIKRRPRGKIARLHPDTREKINRMLDEGLTYAGLITTLGPDGETLTEMDLSRWYKTGHQDWLKNQIWLEQTRSRLDFAIDVVSEHDGASVHQANLHVAATQLIQDLVARGDTLLEDHVQEYVALINSISRLSREALNYQKYREACALARAELQKLKEPNRKLSEAETLAIVERLDEILGFK
jgi:hypothetical protein